MRPFTTYKAFGGVLVVLTIPSVLLAIFDTSRHPLSGVGLILLSILGAMGIYIFEASDRRMRELQRQAEPIEKQVDLKSMATLAVCFILYLMLVVIR